MNNFEKPTLLKLVDVTYSANTTYAKKKKVGELHLGVEVQTEVLEDGSLWMRVKIENEEEWGEWFKESLSL